MEINDSLSGKSAFPHVKSKRNRKPSSTQKNKSLGKGILKFINYTKEAFMLPAHLFTLGIMTAVTAAAMIALPTFFGIDASGLIFMLGGLELLYLGLAPRSKRLTSAVNAKYREELDEYYILKEIVDIYNSMGHHAQRRFEDYRKLLNKVKENYSNLNSSFPDIVEQYLRRIDHLQLSYIRLLSREDKGQIVVTERENPQMWLAQIEGIRKNMVDDSDRVKRIKAGRIKLLEQRIQAYNKKVEARKEVSVQLHAIEEMIKFFHDQPITREESLMTSQAVQDLIDETTDLHDTLSELDVAMANEISDLSKSDEQYASGLDDIRIG